MRRIIVGVLIAIVCVGSWCWAEEKPDEQLARSIEWKFKAEDVKSAKDIDFDDSGWQMVKRNFKWKSKGYSWFRTTIIIPDKIAGDSTLGEPVGMKWNSCDGGEVYVKGKLATRYDNDHPALVILTTRATPGESVPVAVRTYMGPDNNEHDGELWECDPVILEKSRVIEPFKMTADAAKSEGKLFQPFSGLSQGGGMADYKPETAAKFKEIGIKWFRMDNILTSALKKKADGTLYCDWEDLDKRVDFIYSIGAEPIFCISYMPEALDAVPDPERHSYPNDWKEWEDLVYNAVKRCKDRGKPVKYWEVWNEINTGWLKDELGLTHLQMYLKMYDCCARAVKKADPSAWIGGPCVASGPWNKDDKRGPGVNGEEFMRGLFKHCEDTGTPLDFVTWHEYFQPASIMKAEADQIREYLKDYPKVQKQVKELQVTEWNFAWWVDRSHDHELGAAWCAASVLRAWIPAKVDKPCFFFAKDGGMDFRGSWGMLIGDNYPKPVANVCKMFNMMAPQKIEFTGDDGELSGLASTDPKTGRTTILILNFTDRYGVPRNVELTLKNLPAKVRGGTWKRYLVDKDHSNIWNDRSRYELETVDSEKVPESGDLKLRFQLANNGVTLVEVGGESRVESRESRADSSE